MPALAAHPDSPPPAHPRAFGIVGLRAAIGAPRPL